MKKKAAKKGKSGAKRATMKDLPAGKASSVKGGAASLPGAALKLK